jgi:L-threonylcarbamoyladenylate synthase
MARIRTAQIDVPQSVIRTAAGLIRQGQVVAFPTETIYGLGANALDETAVRKVFELKGRPADNPLIVHVDGRRMLRRVVKDIPEGAELLMRRFWPGPLTIILPKTAAVPDITTAGRDDVAVRMPDHVVALGLIKAAGVPIAAPSANKSGRSSPTTAAHVLEDFPGLMVIDGGSTQHGVESTVISLIGKPVVLRLGAVTLERIREVMPEVKVSVKMRKGTAPASPGQKYRHYAPSVPLHVFNDAASLKRYAKSRRCLTILAKESRISELTGLKAVNLGKTDEEIARNLYNTLRSTKKGEILVLAISRRGLGRTIMDRLERAATEGKNGRKRT